MNLHWVIQENILREPEYDSLIEMVQRFSIPHTIIKLVPFEDMLIPEPVSDIPLTVIGTVKLVRIAKERGWNVWLNENFDSRKWVEHYGIEMLNYDAQTCRFVDVPVGDDNTKFFIRPVQDHKVFTGKVISRWEWEEWTKGNVLETRHKDLNDDTLVSYATVKQIFREYRFFVVNGKVITGSVYKVGKNVHHEECKEEDTIAYTQAMVDKWQPDKAFVIDIAYVDINQFKIIEINCINSAGMYACNMQKVFEAIENEL